MTTSHDKRGISVFAPTHLHSESKSETLKQQYEDPLRKFKLRRLIRGKVVGDFGCGNHGETLSFLQKQGASQIWAIDIDTTQCQKIVKKKFKECDSVTTFINSSIEDVSSIPSDSLDFVWCVGVLHHVDNPMRAIAEISRVLKANGYAYVYVLGGESLVSRILFNGIREHYNSSADFRSLFEMSDAKLLIFLKKMVGFTHKKIKISKNRHNRQSKALSF